MTFNFDKTGINKYVDVLKKRLIEGERRVAEELLHNLYSLSPKRTGALASNYSISVNSNVGASFDPNKTSPDFTVPSFTVKDQIYIINNCPYINYVNYGTIHQVPQNFIERSITVTKLNMESILNDLQNIN